MNCLLRVVEAENGYLIIEGGGYNENGSYSRIWLAGSDWDEAATTLKSVLKLKQEEKCNLQKN